MRWPLRRQITLPLIVVAICSLAAVGAINAQYAARQTRQSIERQLAGVANVLAISNFPLTDSVLQQMRELSGAEFIVTDAAGRTRASSLAHPPATLANEQPDRASSTLGAPVSIEGVNYFDRITELSPRGLVADAKWLHVLFSESRYRSAWTAAFVPPIVVGAITIAAVAGVASVIAGRISSGAARLSVEMQRIARGDFSQMDLPTTNDEIRDLSRAVNDTAAKLADYEHHVRRAEQMRTVALLGAGLAHEMRNAATGCRVALDLHAEQCASDAESLAVAKRQLTLMESQLQRFLRAGKPAANSVDRECDLNELVENLLPLVRPVARHAKVDLCWEAAAPDARITGDQEALGQAVINLLLNAIEAVQHAGAAAHRNVRVETRAAGDDHVDLLIADNGPGLDGEISNQLFTPFTTTKPEGVGLGLAVVKQVVDAHRGAIDWTRRDGVTKFRMRIPLAKKGAFCV